VNDANITTQCVTNWLVHWDIWCCRNW